MPLPTNPNVGSGGGGLCGSGSGTAHCGLPTNPDVGLGGQGLCAGGNPCIGDIPVITGLSPEAVGAGSGAFTLTVTGTGFRPDAVVLFNGEERVTLFISDTELQADILDTDVADAGSFNIVVNNPDPGCGPSNAFPFEVSDCPFVLSSFGPVASFSAGTLTIAPVCLATTPTIDYQLIGIENFGVNAELTVLTPLPSWADPDPQNATFFQWDSVLGFNFGPPWDFDYERFFVEMSAVDEIVLEDNSFIVQVHDPDADITCTIDCPITPEFNDSFVNIGTISSEVNVGEPDPAYTGDPDVCSRKASVTTYSTTISASSGVCDYSSLVTGEIDFIDFPVTPVEGAPSNLPFSWQEQDNTIRYVAPVGGMGLWKFYVGQGIPVGDYTFRITGTIPAGTVGNAEDLVTTADGVLSHGLVTTLLAPCWCDSSNCDFFGSGAGAGGDLTELTADMNFELQPTAGGSVGEWLIEINDVITNADSDDITDIVFTKNPVVETDVTSATKATLTRTRANPGAPNGSLQIRFKATRGIEVILSGYHVWE